MAPELHKAMVAAAEAIGAGQAVGDALEAARQALLAAGFDEVEYLELRDAERLTPLDLLDRPARMLAVAWLGGVRLIDNIDVAT